MYISRNWEPGTKKKLIKGENKKPNPDKNERKKRKIEK
jgi:hypothetical protein